MFSFRHRAPLAFLSGVGLVLVAAIAFQPWRVDAVGSDEATFVPITPCRLLDTRPGDQVGPRNTPLGTDDGYSLQVTGSNGRCSIPPQATAVAINLTGVSPSASTYVSIFPDNAVNPGTSALNMVPGQSPTPNKVDVKLSPNGKVKLYNRFGSIHIIGDVLGYYRHDGLANLESRIVALEAAGSVNLEPRVVALEAAQPFAASAYGGNYRVWDGNPAVVVRLTLTAPVAGEFTVSGSAIATEVGPFRFVYCSIESVGFTIGLSAAEWSTSALDGGVGTLATTRTFSVGAGSTHTFDLFCSSNDLFDWTDISDGVLTAIFTPAR